MTETGTLTSFLAARLDEDEAAARAACGNSDDPAVRAAGSRWALRDHRRNSAMIRDENGEVVVYDEGSPTEEEAVHIARHDPARALREVTAERAILEWHYPGFPPEGAPEDLKICGGEEGDGDTWQMATPWPCPQIRALAAIWSDHPDYRTEWAPAGAETREGGLTP